jgi:hypothetical protein
VPEADGIPKPRGGNAAFAPCEDDGRDTSSSEESALVPSFALSLVGRALDGKGEGLGEAGDASELSPAGGAENKNGDVAPGNPPPMTDGPKSFNRDGSDVPSSPNKWRIEEGRRDGCEGRMVFWAESSVATPSSVFD